MYAVNAMKLSTLPDREVQVVGDLATGNIDDNSFPVADIAIPGLRSHGAAMAVPELPAGAAPNLRIREW